MEAQLIETAFAARLPARPWPSTAARQVLPARQSLENRLARYLHAAGVSDDGQRRQLMARCLDELAAQGKDDNASWAEIIATVDSCLLGALPPEGRHGLPQSARGRVALRLGHTAPAGGAKDWGTPARNRRVMQAQDLSPWRPGTAWNEKHWNGARLRRFHVSRPAQGLAACLCWLAVLIIP